MQQKCGCILSQRIRTLYYSLRCARIIQIALKIAAREGSDIVVDTNVIIDSNIVHIDIQIVGIILRIDFQVVLVVLPALALLAALDVRASRASPAMRSFDGARHLKELVQKPEPLKTRVFAGL